LIGVALITATVSCDNGVESCTLTISSTSGGSVTTPGQGAFTYDKGSIVNLVAEADDGYRFVSWTGSISTIADVNGSDINITMNGNYAVTAQFKAKFMVSTGGLHTVGLKTDSSVVAVGWNDNGQCNVGNWTDIAQIAAGVFHTVGLKSDGTVVAVGENIYGECDVGDWIDIVQVAAGTWHTVGLEGDGTVVAVRNNDDGQYDVGGWNLITGRPPINWLLFGGIIAAVIAVGLVIFFVRRRRRGPADTSG
jgi:hypothetical protein